MTQREAALAAVRQIGFNQIRPVEQEIFAQLPQYYEMFTCRLALLQENERSIAQ